MIDVNWLGPTHKVNCWAIFLHLRIQVCIVGGLYFVSALASLLLLREFGCLEWYPEIGGKQRTLIQRGPLIVIWHTSGPILHIYHLSLPYTQFSYLVWECIYLHCCTTSIRNPPMKWSLKIQTWLSLQHDKRKENPNIIPTAYQSLTMECVFRDMDMSMTESLSISNVCLKLFVKVLPWISPCWKSCLDREQEFFFFFGCVDYKLPLEKGLGNSFEYCLVISTSSCNDVWL